MMDFETSKDKVLMGPERKSMILSESEKKNTAYHEAGHALVAANIPDADPLHKVTIIPRGWALGLTQQLPLDDKHTYTREYLEAQLAVLMGGRVAEELFLHHMTTGAGNDIERATQIARDMVCEYGMSNLGPLAFGKNQQEIFLGRDIATQRDFSEDTAIKIDQEVKTFVTTGYERAKNILTDQPRCSDPHRGGPARARSSGRQRSKAADRRQAPAGIRPRQAPASASRNRAGAQAAALLALGHAAPRAPAAGLSAERNENRNSKIEARTEFRFRFRPRPRGVIIRL